MRACATTERQNMRFTLRKSLVPALLVGAVGLATPALAQLLGGGQLGGSVGGVTGNADMTGELSRKNANTSTSPHARKSKTDTSGTSAPAMQAAQNSTTPSNGSISGSGSAS